MSLGTEQRLSRSESCLVYNKRQELFTSETLSVVKSKTTFLILIVCIKARKGGNSSFLFLFFRGSSTNDEEGKSSDF